MEETLPKSTSHTKANHRIEPPKYTFQTIRLTATELAHYPNLTQLTAMMNNAFAATALMYPGLFNPDLKRYNTPSELVEDMGPHGLLFLTLAKPSSQPAAPPHPIATTGYKPWTNIFTLGQRLNTTFTLTDFPETHDPPNINTPEFEIKAVTVDPEFRSQGLASDLFAQVTEEIFECVRRRGEGGVRLMVSVIKEINEGYWKAKGFVGLREMRFGVGTAGSLRGFSHLDMCRDCGV